MTTHAQMTLMDILARNRAQIFVAGILIEAFANLRPANLIIKLTNLLFCVLSHQSFQAKGSPTRNLYVSPNSAIPSAPSAFSSGHTFRSSQKFINRHGNGRGYSKK